MENSITDCAISGYKCVKAATPPWRGGSVFLEYFFFGKPFKCIIFSLTQSIGLSGCLEEKTNVIRPLENFLSDFEKKKVQQFFYKKISFIGKFSWQKLFLLELFVANIYSSNASKKLLTHYFATLWVSKMFSKIRAI